MLPVKKTNRNFTLVKLHHLHLFFGFHIFFVLNKIPHLGIPTFHFGILWIKIRFISMHKFCITNNKKIILKNYDSTFIDPFIKFWSEYLLCSFNISALLDWSPAFCFFFNSFFSFFFSSFFFSSFFLLPFGIP